MATNSARGQDKCVASAGKFAGVFIKVPRIFREGYEPALQLAKVIGGAYYLQARAIGYNQGNILPMGPWPLGFER